MTVAKNKVFDYEKWLQILCPDAFIFNADSAMAYERFHKIVTSNKPAHIAAAADDFKNSASQDFDALMSIVDNQTLAVIIDADLLIERAIVILSVRHKTYSSLMPMRIVDIREIVDELLLKFIRQYPICQSFVVVHSYQLAPNTAYDKANEYDIKQNNTYWGDRYYACPFHPTLFGYQYTGNQGNAALLCWRDLFLTLYNMSRIFGDVVTRLEPRLLAMGRAFSLQFFFPLLMFAEPFGQTTTVVETVDAITNAKKTIITTTVDVTPPILTTTTTTH